jgi:hypothetical protein
VTGGLRECKVESDVFGKSYWKSGNAGGAGIATDPGLKEDTTKIGEILTCVKHHGIDTEDMKGLLGQHRKQIMEI